jgi:hypothetical protein
MQLSAAARSLYQTCEGSFIENQRKFPSLGRLVRLSVEYCILTIQYAQSYMGSEVNTIPGYVLSEN